MKSTQQATFISLTANSNKSNELSDFLKAGATIVNGTEPDTLLWAALKQPDEKSDNQYAIFDTFSNSDARNSHFEGKVATALCQNSDNLIKGGWEKGVVENINNSKVLFAKVPLKHSHNITKAVFITINSLPGKQQQLINFLKTGGQMVKDDEPLTIFWYALQLSENSFCICDFFENQSGVDAHFSGGVAEALNAKSGELIHGGWENGVLSNIKSYDVLALTTQP